MSRRDSPARGGFALRRSPAHRSVRRAALFARSLGAALVLAFYTVAGVLAAALALAPTLLTRAPEGRRVTPLRRAREGAEAPAPAPAASQAEEALPR